MYLNNAKVILNCKESMVISFYDNTKHQVKAFQKEILGLSLFLAYKCC